MKLWGSKKQEDAVVHLPTLIDGRLYKVQGIGKLIARPTEKPNEWTLNTPVVGQSGERQVIRVLMIRFNTRLLNMETLELYRLSGDSIDKE